MKRVALLLAVVAALAGAGAARAADVFDGAGVFVDDPANFPGPWALADRVKASGFSWVAFKLHDGETVESLDPMWVDVFRARGISVGGWGVEQRRARDDATLAASLVNRYGLDFYIANAELTYRTDSGGGWRSGAFVTTFRTLEPSLPAALVTYGGAPAPYVLPIDWTAWRSGGFELLPEAYYNQWKQYRPDLTVAHALRAGWTRSAVHPVIGVYRGYPAARYVPLLEQAGTRGFSIWLADQAKPSDYAALAQLAAAQLTRG